MDENEQGYTRLHNKLNYGPESLCSFCGNACRNGCSWAEDFTPVPGWEAVENKNGWFVVDCPEYCSDEWMHEDASELDTEGCIRLLTAFISVLRDDYRYMYKSRPAIERYIRSDAGKSLLWFADPDDIIAQLRKEMNHKL